MPLLKNDIKVEYAEDAAPGVYGRFRPHRLHIRIGDQSVSNEDILQSRDLARIVLEKVLEKIKFDLVRDGLQLSLFVMSQREVVDIIAALGQSMVERQRTKKTKTTASLVTRKR